MDGITLRTLTYQLDQAIETYDVNTPVWMADLIETIYNSGETMLSHGQEMVFLNNEEGVLYYPDDYDEEVRQKFDNTLESGDCVVDVGASLGYYTLRAADLIGDEGRVYAFEPEGSRYDALRESIEINDLKENVTVSDRPVADTSDEINIRERTGQEEWTTRTAEAVTLDDVVESTPDLIKIDCEGLEYHVLEGARKLVERNRPDIFCEIHPSLIKANSSTVADIEDFAETFEYNMYCVDARSRVEIESIPTRTEHSLASATLLLTKS